MAAPKPPTTTSGKEGEIASPHVGGHQHGRQAYPEDDRRAEVRLLVHEDEGHGRQHDDAHHLAELEDSRAPAAVGGERR